MIYLAVEVECYFRITSSKSIATSDVVDIFLETYELTH